MEALTVKGGAALKIGGQTAVIAGYCRVSTDSDDQANAMVVQKSKIKASGVDVLFEDVLSGANSARPGYLALKKLIISKQVAEVVINNVSRLGRDFAEAVTFVNLCDEAGVTLTSLCQPGRPLTLKDSTQMLMTIFPMALAQTSRLDLIEKVKAGFEHGRTMGKPMRKPCYGYVLSKDRMRLEPHPEHWEEARRFIEFLKGLNWRMFQAFRTFPWKGGYERRTIRRDGKVMRSKGFAQPGQAPWSRITGLRAWLLNPTLRGGIAYNQISNHKHTEILWERHQPVMSHDEFALFEKVSKVNRRMYGANVDVKLRPLTSLCVCDECSKKMCYVGQRTHPAVRCKTEGCSQHYKSTREEVILREVVPRIIDRAKRLLEQADVCEEIENPKITELEISIKQMEKMLTGPMAAQMELLIQQAKAQLATEKAKNLRHGPDPEVHRRLADPEIWAKFITKDRDRLTAVLHSSVAEIRIRRQQVADVSVLLGQEEELYQPELVNAD